MESDRLPGHAGEPRDRQGHQTRLEPDAIHCLSDHAFSSRNFHSCKLHLPTSVKLANASETYISVLLLDYVLQLQTLGVRERPLSLHMDLSRGDDCCYGGCDVLLDLLYQEAP